ncbi:TonB-dependent receptor [Parasphingorhabdus sp.]|uniref:TonB-dependent receptor n=1 Tax=Parasphingorhabdus sp. TaxID=2709688 RepID=UPI003A8D2145
MKIKYLLAASVVSLSTAGLMAVPASAQSTGTVDFEDNVIIVTGGRSDVGGVEIPKTPKAKQVLDEEIIRRQRPGQTVNDIVNLVPGVSFQNNDPWGSSGGSFTIRGFSSDRISQTLDGLPLNDSGNYALYTNQQVDSEIFEQVNVNLGVTDVDSPTASAVGGTINLRTREPSDDFKLTGTLSVGDVFAKGKPNSRMYMRGFGMIDTGDITGMGTKAFVSASYVRYDNPFNNYGRVDKQQYNGRIWQDIGSDGDFVAVAGHYNENRNNFFGSFSLNSFPETRADRFYDINYPCTVDSVPGVFETPAEVAAPGYVDPDGVNGCGAEFDRRFNPSNTGNIRGASRFTLAEGLVLTVDPSYQYVKANGGGNEELLEGTRNVGGTEMTGFLSGRYYYGRDLNGDGDMLDEVSGFDPSQTRTHRFGVISNLSFKINEDHSVRLAYTYDDANHRQTGSTSVALLNGDIADVFPINDPLQTADGFTLNKRDRQSYATLHQVSGEYRGNFGDLTAVIGLRAPFFTRELNQNCYTTSASGFLDCVGGVNAAYEAANPYVFDAATNTVTGSAVPQSRTYKYDDILPNIGLTYSFGQASVFVNYAKGLSVPGTDPLYNSLYFPSDAPGVQPLPETTDSIDLGVRYQNGNIQAQAAGWFTRYNDRLATAYDPVLDKTIFRNLGRVDKYGIDGSIAWMPTPDAMLYVFGSINESEIKDDVQLGAGNFAPTAGKNESGAPVWSVGARAQYRVGAFELGAQVKHTGKRWVNDINTASVDGYTLVDLDLRWTIAENPFGDDVALQLNVTNLFDELYVGGFGGGLTSTGPFVQIGSPRAASLSLIFGY